MPDNVQLLKRHDQAHAELQVQYGLRLYDDSLARYRALDAKAARSLPTYALILTLLSFLPSQLDAYTLPGHLLSIVGCVFTAGALCAVAGLGCLVRAMGTKLTAALPNDEQTRYAFQSTDALRLSRDLAKRAHKAALDVDNESDKKANAVKWGLRLWTPAISLILLSVLLMVTLSVTFRAAATDSEPSPPKELRTVTEDREPNQDADEPSSPRDGAEQAGDKDKDDGNVLGPNRYLRESRELPEPPVDQDDS